MNAFVEAAKQFFTTSEWDAMSAIDRYKYGEYYYVYNSCIDLGIDVVIPDFINKFIGGSLLYSCEYCAIVYVKEAHLILHMNTCRSKSNLYGPEEAQLLDEQHTNTNPQSEQFKCTECKYQTAYESLFKTHITIHSGLSKPLEGTEHESQTSNKTNLKELLRKYIQPKPFKCTECKYRTAHENWFKTHMAIHSLLSKPSEGTEHEDRTANKTDLKEPMTNTQLKSFKCNECDFKTAYIHSLKEHQAKHSDKSLSALKPLKCKQCEYTTASMRHYKAHVVAHMNNVAYPCPHCEFRSPYKNDLKRHIATHVGTKHYTKEQVKNHFEKKHFKGANSSNSNFKAHLVTPIGSNLYKCTECEFQTPYRMDLRRHMATHPGIKKFKCTECNYATKWITSFKRHTTSKHTPSTNVSNAPNGSK